MCRSALIGEAVLPYKRFFIGSYSHKTVPISKTTGSRLAGRAVREASLYFVGYFVASTQSITRNQKDNMDQFNELSRGTDVPLQA